MNKKFEKVYFPKFEKAHLYNKKYSIHARKKQLFSYKFYHNLRFQKVHFFIFCVLLLKISTRPAPWISHKKFHLEGVDFQK